MWVLTGWGALNMGSGIIGALSTKNAEVKAFHTMNALWGVVNTGIGVLGLLRAQKEKDYTFLMLINTRPIKIQKNYTSSTAGWMCCM